jgi:hypothetical protein
MCADAGGFAGLAQFLAVRMRCACWPHACMFILHRAWQAVDVNGFSLTDGPVTACHTSLMAVLYSHSVVPSCCGIPVRRA